MNGICRVPTLGTSLKEMRGDWTNVFMPLLGDEDIHKSVLILMYQTYNCISNKGCEPQENSFYGAPIFLNIFEQIWYLN